MIDVVVIGSGNLAYSLSLAISEAEEGCRLLQIYSRNRSRGEELSNIAKCDYTDDLNELKKADIYIIALRDDVVGSVSREIAAVVESDAIIAHTSAMCDVEKGEMFARFYPLQTFTYEIRTDFKKITLFIEANCEKRERKLITLSSLIAKGYEIVDAKRLKVVHLAATFANNFTNRMFHYAEKVLESENISRDVLYPLIEEGVAKIERSDASVRDLQSGVAIRGDQRSMDLHRKLIDELKDEEMLEVYNVVTKTICNDKF